MPKGPVGVAVIGAGVISRRYLDNLIAFPDLAVHVVASRHPEAAMARAEEYGIGEYGSPEVALAHPDVEIIVNLTIPAVHAEIDLAAIRAGKHVWSETPIALDRTTEKALLAEAEASGLRIGCAPDTFLGAGLQTARRVIERGDIGVPLTALTLLQAPGPEAWHPNPAFHSRRPNRTDGRTLAVHAPGLRVRGCDIADSALRPDLAPASRGNQLAADA